MAAPTCHPPPGHPPPGCPPPPDCPAAAPETPAATDPDPLLASLTEDIPARKNKKKKGKPGLIIGLVVLILLGGMGGGLFFLKDMVIGFVPEMEPVYEMIGMGESPGEGLERGTEGGVDSEGQHYQSDG